MKQHTSNGVYQFLLILALALCFQFTGATVQGLSPGGGGNPVQQTPSSSQKVVCRFRGREYSPGEVWYPTSTIVTGYCVSCTCLNSGRQNCSKLECPSNCRTNEDRMSSGGTEHPCCSSCGVKTETEANRMRVGAANGRSSSVDTSFQSTGGNKTPFGHWGMGLNNESSEGVDEDEDEIPAVTENPEFITCLHQGMRYRDGDSFTANMSGLPIASVDQCMQCKCQTGMVVCHMDACSGFKCESSGPSSIGDTCCQRCAARRVTKTRKPDEDVVRQIVVRKPYGSANNGNGQRPPSSTGFVENGMFDSESAVAFRDVNNIRALGNMARDNNGLRKQATDDCISAGRFYMHGSVWHPIIGPFGAMECVVCKCNHGQIECQSLKCPPRRELSCSKPVKVEGHCCPICNSQQTSDRQQTNVETGQAMCLPVKQDVTAFKSQGVGTNGTELIEFAFLRQRTTNPDTQVEAHLWTLRGGDIDEFTTQYLSTVQFDNLRNRQTFVLLGGTNEKNIEKFTRREKKLEKRCFTKCSIRITSLERSLRLHRVISRPNCLAYERLVVAT